MGRKEYLEWELHRIRIGVQTLKFATQQRILFKHIVRSFNLLLESEKINIKVNYIGNHSSKYKELIVELATGKASFDKIVDYIYEHWQNLSHPSQSWLALPTSLAHLASTRGCVASTWTCVYRSVATVSVSRRGFSRSAPCSNPADAIRPGCFCFAKREALFKLQIDSFIT